MSKILFDGATHQITLYDAGGKAVGSWIAYNHVDSHATLTHIQNGMYSFQDTQAPYHHTPDPNGPYGSHGIFRFNVPGHPGIGLHSGRANARYQPGPQHATMGCIRTTDEAMAFIVGAVKQSPLTFIEVAQNSAVSVAVAKSHHHHKHIHHVRARRPKA